MIVKESVSPVIKRLTECERVIERGFTVFVEVGQALAEIRDARLYRDSHKTFEDYCKARWDIGRSRAYELIDHATVTTALAKAGVDLSATADISKRDVRTLKDNLPAAAKEIQTRVRAGEDPAKATHEVIENRRAAKDEAKKRQQEQQADFDRQRQEHAAKLPESIRQQQAAKDAAITARKTAPPTGLTDQDRIAELEEANRSLEAEVEALRAQNKTYAEMMAQFAQGGFDKVIAGKDEEIRVASARFYTENADKISWMKSANFWKAEALKLGFSSDEIIPVEPQGGGQE